MKKSFIIFLAAFLLSALPVSAQTSESGGFANDINAGTVNQYIFINCDTEECDMIIQKIMERVQDGAPVYASLPAQAGGNSAVVQEQVQPDAPAAPVQTAPVEPVQPVAENAYQSIRISEIVSAPVSGESEWVEVYNQGIEPVDLDNWSLIEGSNRSTKLFGVIQPKNYLVFDKSSLNNDGDIIILKDQTGKTIDEVIYGGWNDGNVSDNAPAPQSSESLILWDNQYLVTESPTPALQNVLFVTQPAEVVEPAPSVEPVASVEPLPVSEPAVEASDPSIAPSAICSPETAIRINEFLADPEGEDTAEWIELYNDSESEVDLSGWTIDDLDGGGSAPYVLPAGTRISAKGYLILEKAQTKLSLNNTSDSVVLKNQTAIVSKFDYASTATGKSWAYFDADWELTGQLTPGAANRRDGLQTAGVSETEKNKIEYMSVTAKEARALAINTKAKVLGQVAALPGSFGSKIMYLNGLQIYMSDADWPELALGDQVEILGKISSASGEKRLLVANAADIDILGAGTLEPEFVSSGEMVARFSGVLVSAEGELVLKSGSLFTLNDAQGEFGVLFKQGAGVETKLFQTGEVLKVAGIVAKKEEKYVIMPRSPADIQNKTLDQMPFLGAPAVSAVLPKNKAKSRALWIIGSFAGLLASIKTWIFLRKKRKNYLAEINKMRQTLVAKYS